jgi:Microsomal signal peptidase 12 kDa subunit (SPC12)
MRGFWASRRDFTLTITSIIQQVVSFFAGFLLQSLTVTYGIFGAATVLTALVSSWTCCGRDATDVWILFPSACDSAVAHVQ